jgi:hypothetical protein
VASIAIAIIAIAVTATATAAVAGVAGKAVIRLNNGRKLHSREVRGCWQGFAFHSAPLFLCHKNTLPSFYNYLIKKSIFNIKAYKTMAMVVRHLSFLISPRLYRCMNKLQRRFGAGMSGENFYFAKSKRMRFSCGSTR